MADGSDPRTQPSFLRTALWLAAFVVLAFALRSVFTAAVDIDPGTGNHLYTGNDPYYHHRTATNVVETGQNLNFDPAINYPEGRDNPNPPLWTWTSAALGVALQALHLGGPDYIGTALDVMVAFWGALCVIPIYMIGRDLWGRRAGLWAAFFIAVSAPHIQRSIWGYADHDAISMFFVMLAFAFLVRGLKALDVRPYVASWNAGVGDGLRRTVLANRNPLAYAGLAGLCVTACALTWKGYPYVFGIIAVAAFFQLVLDHLRNRDSTITWMVYTLVIAIGALLPWALYYHDFPYQMLSTVNPSLYVLYGVLLLGLVLVPTRDLPSILVFPALLVGGILAALYLYTMQPGIWGSITTGLGYFQQSKLYSTIAEAQRPQLGEVAATLGFFTFLLAFWGFFRTVRVGLRGDGPNILVASWAIVAIFMMFAAARFEVNAAPLFCVLLGYTLDRIIAWMGAAEVRKRFRSQHGQNIVARSFRSLSWKPALVAVAIALFLVLPNAWLGFDSAMPFEYKGSHMPGLLDNSRDPKTGNYLHPPRLGAFGISFEDIAGQENWVQVMDGLSKRDTCWSDSLKVCEPGTTDYRPIESRPAFIGWWDYGHWAIGIGHHPTVADPFQSHFEASGLFLASDSEAEAMDASERGQERVQVKRSH
ncbi:MAG: STT3 domain-containing protein [Thermoplasmatota archaeon]